MAVIICEQRDVHAVHVPPHKRNIGVMLALLSAVLMAVGLVLSKEAIRQGLPPLPLSLMRNATACIIIWCAALALGHIRSAWMALKTHPQVWKLLPLGCITGPAGGIWLSSVALENLPAAVASSAFSPLPSSSLQAFSNAAALYAAPFWVHVQPVQERHCFFCAEPVFQCLRDRAAPETSL